jgi:cold shock CspA family protein
MTGRIKTFNNERGFGFVRGHDGEWFVHRTGLVDQSYVPHPGDLVEYRLGINSRTGNTMAVDVRIVSRAAA